MDRQFHLDRQDSFSAESGKHVFEGIIKEAAKAKGMDPISTFAISARDSQGNFAGGANGVTYYGCLYVDMLWVDLAARGRGLGSLLMQEAELIGRERGCSFATVNTMDWEALPFYQKLGYDIEFTREGYAKDSKMYLLRKSL